MADRERLSELTTQLRDAAKRQDPIAKAVIRAVEISIEIAKESLVDADGNDMLRLQGGVRTLRTLHRELTRTPPNIAEGADQS